MGSILPFTNSANRTVINSTVASTIATGDGDQLQAEASAHAPPLPLGLLLFYSWRLALALGVPSGPMRRLRVTPSWARLRSIARRSVGALLRLSENVRALFFIGRTGGVPVEREDGGRGAGLDSPTMPCVPPTALLFVALAQRSRGILIFVSGDD